MTHFVFVGISCDVQFNQVFEYKQFVSLKLTVAHRLQTHVIKTGIFIN
jgi:hypothetical protein